MRGLWILLAMVACRCGSDKDDTGWNPANGEACLSCHEGIERAHPVVEHGDCTACHGGDGESLTQEGAHVPVPDDWAAIRGDGLPAAPHGYIKDMPPDMLDQLNPDYIRFINPGDIRAADAACGDCHPDEVAWVKNSVMTTNAGHYMPTRYYAGVQDREAVYGSFAAFDDAWQGAPGTSEQLVTLPPPTEDELQEALDAVETDPSQIEALAYDHYLAKNCNTCHAAGYGRNNSRALYRSTGCSSCHVVYSTDGVYEGDDAAIPNNVPVYPRRHEITTAIPTEQCATCHFQGGRIGLLFRGIREGGFGETPEHAEVWSESVYGHVSGYYILDEDTRNTVDETPPDLHYAAGMHCVDCHVGSDVHGDGRIYATSKLQLDLRCEDCHGDSREPVAEDSEGVFRTAGGRELPQLHRDGQGQVVLTGKVDGAEHVVPQPADILDDRGDGSYIHLGMGEDADGWSHTDSLRCDACHTSYNQQCLGCHVSLDLRLNQVDYQTGLRTPGLTRGSRTDWNITDTLLCLATDGRAQNCNSSQQVQMAVIDQQGEVVLGEAELDENGQPTGGTTGVFRNNEQYSGVIGWSPFFQHTSSRTPKPCSACHRTNDTPEEWTRVKGVYGYGTGQLMLDNPNGDPIDALQFLNEQGEQVTDFVHEGTGPLSAESRERALGVTLE